MRKFLFACAVLLAGSMPVLAAAETINTKVNGMVCAFCAQGIEASFRKLPEVASVHVDLDQFNVRVETKGNLSIDDATVRRIIIDAGFEVVEIKRGAG